MATDRARPAQNAGEREMLTGWLEHHRGILIWKCEDLTAEQLRRRAVPPSTLSLLGLVRHMAEVERGWFRQMFLGEDVPDLYDRSADRDADFNAVDQADPAEAFNVFERECAASRLVVAQAPSLDVLSKQASERTGQPWSLRWIVTHMIEEYARHNGHADLLRERVDGSTGYYLAASSTATLRSLPHHRCRAQPDLLDRLTPVTEPGLPAGREEVCVTAPVAGSSVVVSSRPRRHQRGSRSLARSITPRHGVPPVVAAVMPGSRPDSGDAASPALAGLRTVLGQGLASTNIMASIILATWLTDP